MSAQNRPQTVIVMSCHNCAATLEACLESLHAQTLADWVLLAADDGSSDQTPAMLQAAAQADQRIRVFAYTDNKGLAARLNALIDVALAEYPGAFIARMDGDDICAPDRFEKQVSYLNEHPAIGVVASWGRCIAPDGSPVKERVETATAHDHIAVNGFFSAPLLHPSVMFRPGVLQALGQPVYDPSLRRAQDFDLWARLVPFTKFAVLPEYLLTYRLGSDKRIDKEHDLNRFRRIIVERNLQRLGIADKDEAWMAAAYAIVGFPLPKISLKPGLLPVVLRDIIAANDHAKLYDPALFQEKLEAKYSKARRRVKWWKQALQVFGRTLAARS